MDGPVRNQQFNREKYSREIHSSFQILSHTGKRDTKKSLEKIKNAVSAIFYIENSNPQELSLEIDRLIDLIKDENLDIIRDFSQWFNNYLSSI